MTIPKDIWYVLRYMMVGASALAIDAMMFAIAGVFLGEGHATLRVAISGGCAYVGDFLGHKFFTFRIHGDASRQLALHFAMKLGAYGLRLVSMYVLTVIIGLGEWTSYGITLMIGVGTYLGSQWIFLSRKPKHAIAALINAIIFLARSFLGRSAKEPAHDS